MDKDRCYTNGEGYTDRTAGDAIRQAENKEGGVAMAKKKNCRRTTDENAIHIKAVKMRKMTDEQLVHYVEDRTEKARSEGFNKGRAQASKAKPADIVKILKDIRDIRGIGTSKLTDIGAVLEKHLEVDKKC